MPLRDAAEAYERQVAIAREAFTAFIPRFNGDDAPREAYLSDPARCAAGAAAIRQMLDQERRAVRNIEQALDAIGGG